MPDGILIVPIDRGRKNLPKEAFRGKDTSVPGYPIGYLNGRGGTGYENAYGLACGMLSSGRLAPIKSTVSG